mgnify:CR=1 FL=1
MIVNFLRKPGANSSLKNVRFIIFGFLEMFWPSRIVVQRFKDYIFDLTFSRSGLLQTA